MEESSARYPVPAHQPTAIIRLRREQPGAADAAPDWQDGRLAHALHAFLGAPPVPLFEHPGGGVVGQAREGDWRRERARRRLPTVEPLRWAKRFLLVAIPSLDNWRELESFMRGRFGEIVEEVYPVAFATPAALATPDFRARQFHLPCGSDGQQITVADIEGAWRLTHESLTAAATRHVFGQFIADLAWEDHGTGALALVGARSAGVCGIASQASLVVASHFDGILERVAEAIAQAARYLVPGDVLLLEIQIPGPHYNFAERIDQRGYVPVEWRPEVFNVVRDIVDQGVAVVAAAGNGAEDLDASRYRGKFDRRTWDSGAILVAATDRAGAPASFSNAGSRIDCLAAGDAICTAGGGDLFGKAHALPRDRWYTQQFGGTSSAAAIIAGLIAVGQGDRLLRGKTPLDPDDLSAITRGRTVVDAAGVNSYLDALRGAP